MNLTIANWNIAGAKYFKDLGEPENDQDQVSNQYREVVNILSDILDQSPDVVMLQEVPRVLSGDGGNFVDVLEEVKEIQSSYNYEFYENISSERNLVRPVFDRLLGRFPQATFQQGYAILYRNYPREPKSNGPQPIWAEHNKLSRNCFDTIPLSTGLYFGTRDTEPRLAILGRFRKTEDGRELEFCILNVHLPTLNNERENLPAFDDAAQRRRLRHVQTILEDIVSPYNERLRDTWSQRELKQKTPLWIIAGDLNCMLNGEEHVVLKRANFLDGHVSLGRLESDRGTKLVGGKPASTLDYIYYGPRFTLESSIDDDVEAFVGNTIWGDSTTDYVNFPSDHLPLLLRLDLDSNCMDQAGARPR